LRALTSSDVNRAYYYFKFQVFICWRKETEFDEELKDLVEKCGAQTFSTSENAFRKLQNEVLPDSTIALKK